MRLSLNQATTRPYGLAETARAASAAGVRDIGLWLESVAEVGTAEAGRILRDTGMAPSSMSRVGFVADKEGVELEAAIDASKRALDVCAELEVPYLAFIPGGLGAPVRQSTDAGEARVRDALERLAPHAAGTGVALAVEPLHPLQVCDRSVISRVAQALRVIEDLPAERFGVLVDAWATHWDPELREAILLAGAQGRLRGYQIDDFVLPLPTPDYANGRVMPGEGWIDLRSISSWVAEAGYSGPVEVEVFNKDIWALPLEEIIDRMRSSAAASIPGIEIEERAR